MAHNAGMTPMLDGITIVDLTRVLAGPYCTMVLGDLGARVIKVEAPGRGDDARAIGPFLEDGGSAYFAALNRGKQSIALDLKAADDRAWFDRLLSRADVLVENFRPGVMDKLGYGTDALARDHPHLIACAISGFGQTGPYRGRAAYDMVVQAMGGIMSITGWPGGKPTRVGASVGDITAGLFAATAINAALFDRTRTGRGRALDLSMLDCQIAILENAIARYQVTGTPPGPLGARHPSIAPFAAFEAADGWLVLAAGNDALFARLAQVLARPDLATDPRFATNEDRCAHVETLHETLEDALQAAPVADWLKRLDAEGIPCGPINDIAGALADPQVRARNMVVSDGRLDMAGNPVKSPGLPDPAARRPAPALDADRSAVIAWLDAP